MQTALNSAIGHIMSSRRTEPTDRTDREKRTGWLTGMTGPSRLSIDESVVCSGDGGWWWRRLHGRTEAAPVGLMLFSVGETVGTVVKWW